MRRLMVLLFLLGASAAILPAESTPSAALLVLSKQDHTIAIVDPRDFHIVAKAPVGDDPHEVIASTDGHTAYVSNYGFGQFHTITAIDLVGQKQIGPIDLGALRGPHGLDFVDGKLWFTAEAAKSIGSYDPATGKIDRIIGIGQNRTHMVYVFPGTKRIVTTNVNSGSITVLDKTEGAAGAPMGPPPGMPPPPPGSQGPQGGPRRLPGPPGGDWNETVIAVGKGSEGFDVSPDGTQVWTANAGDGTISVVDLAALRLTDTIKADVPGANRLKFTLDGKRALISLLGSPDLVVLDAATHAVIKRLPIGHGAAGILMEPGGKRAFVACTPDNYVAVIDLESLTMVGKIDAGGNPDGLAWAVQH
ncbi:MAG TPA: YncE family protein [Terracidiphilus sp.]|nr:YncE family protein [Terracidiphilus sp.]